MVEIPLLFETQKLGKLFPCFPRKSNHQACADHNFGQRFAQVLDGLQDIFFASFSVHSTQKPIGNMLDGHVKIGANPRVTFHQSDQIGVDLIGIKLQKTEPKRIEAIRASFSLIGAMPTALCDLFRSRPSLVRSK